MLMMKQQKGFTLIELMIVVAIIGILAAVAIPAYTDYLKRAKVAEAISLMAGMKTPVEEFLGTKEEWPTIGQIGSKTTGKYTTSIVISPPSIVATMKKSLGTISLQYDSTLQEWSCVIPSSGGVEISYAPSSCE